MLSRLQEEQPWASKNLEHREKRIRTYGWQGKELGMIIKISASQPTTKERGPNKLYRHNCDRHFVNSSAQAFEPPAVGILGFD